MRSLAFIISSTLVLSAIFVHADDYGCGVFLPLTTLPKPPATNTAAQNQSHYNSFCANWQCSKAAIVLSPSEMNPDQDVQLVCVRGAEVDGYCLVDSDCYADDVLCKNVSISVDAHTNITTYGLRCTKEKTEASASVVGFVAVFLASIFWGSNFIPARASKPGNGILFQLIMCCGIAFVAFITQTIRATGNGGFVFYPSASIGGMLWAIANTCAIPLIALNGVGLAIALWCSGNLLFGWLSATFGFWGLSKPTLARPYLSYIGVVFGIICFVLLAFVRPTRHDVKNSDDKKELQKTLTENTRLIDGEQVDGEEETTEAEVDAEGRKIDVHEFPIIGVVGGFRNARILGVTGCLAIGCLFGLNNDPVVRLMDNYREDSRTNIIKSGPQGLDYVFSHFCGALFTSLVMALLLGLYEMYRNKYPESKIGKLPELFGAVDEPMKMIWPAFICGVGWALAQEASFFSTTKLGMEIAYPMVTLGPSVVSVLWSLFYFKELEGRQNLMFLLAAFAAAAISVALTVSSRSS